MVEHAAGECARAQGLDELAVRAGGDEGQVAYPGADRGQYVERPREALVVAQPQGLEPADARYRFEQVPSPDWVQEWLSRTSGVILIALGVRLALESR